MCLSYRVQFIQRGVSIGVSLIEPTSGNLLSPIGVIQLQCQEPLNCVFPDLFSEEIRDKKPHVRRALGQTPCEVWIPFRAVRDVYSHRISISS